MGGGGGKETGEKGSKGEVSELFVSKTTHTYYPKCRKIIIYREAVVGSWNLQQRLQYHAKYMGSRPMQYIKGRCRSGVPPVPDH